MQQSNAYDKEMPQTQTADQPYAQNRDSHNTTNVKQPAFSSPARRLLDWLQSLKQFFIKMSYHIVVASLTLMALF